MKSQPLTGKQCMLLKSVVDKLYDTLQRELTPEEYDILTDVMNPWQHKAEALRAHLHSLVDDWIDHHAEIDYILESGEDVEGETEAFLEWALEKYPPTPPTAGR